MPDVFEILTAMKGKEIWGAMGGPVHGSTLGLQIGERRERKVPLTNPRISEDLRRFEGEFGLLVSCAWRLAFDGRVVCSSLSRNEADGEIIHAAVQLAGQTIRGIDVTRPFLDFVLHFEDGQLAVFCDEAEPHDGRDNYHITLADSIVVVGSASVVRTERRTFEVRPPLRPV